jgi:hypothetical protein
VTARTEAVAVRTAWYGRVLFAVGAALTATTGLGLWGSPEAFGGDFAWEIRAQLTAAWMGSWYLVAAAALVLGLRESVWSTARIALVVAFTLTATSLVATIRFFDEFRVGDGGVLQQAVAWIWLVVYTTLPPAVAIVFAIHERAGAEHERRRPLTRLTRTLLAGLALGCAALGIWLTVAPGGLIEVWPWTINDLSASILGTWLVTVAAGCAWALRDGDWQRSRIVLLPSLAAPVLLLIAAVRLEGEFTGSDVSVAVYVAAVVGSFAALVAVGIAQERTAR